MDATPPPPIPPGAQPFDPSLPSGLRRDVDHRFGELREYRQTLLPGYNEARRIRDLLADGTAVEDGTQVVDGRELIRVVGVEPDPQHVTLVDPDTYRPVMLLGCPGSEAEYVMTFEYLPRTPENLTLLSPPVPEGLTPTDTVHGDSERAGRCGP